MFKQQQSIILASQSLSRKKVLNFANIHYNAPDIIVSDQEEGIFKQKVKHLKIEDYVQEISNFKGLIVSQQHPEEYVLSGDQACVFNGQEVSKPYSKSEAIAQLTSFSGQTLQLVTSVSLCKNGKVIWQHQETPEIHLTKFSMSDAQNYVETEESNGNSVIGIAGSCLIESPLSMHMVKQAKGNNHSIMGLPIHALIHKLYDLKLFI